MLGPQRKFIEEALVMMSRYTGWTRLSVGDFARRERKQPRQRKRQPTCEYVIAKQNHLLAHSSMYVITRKPEPWQYLFPMLHKINTRKNNTLILVSRSANK